MLRPVDLEKGQAFHFRAPGEGFTCRFLKSKSNGDLVFERLDIEERHHVDRETFLASYSVGGVARLNEAELHGSHPAIEPAAFEPIQKSDSPSIEARKRKYINAVTQQYYILCIDNLGLSRSDPALRKFIAEHEPIHKKLGLGKAPGPSTLISLYRECGKPGYRPLHLFVNGSGGDQKSGLWEKYILDLKAAMREAYWSKDKPSEPYVIKWFEGKVAEERKRRGPLRSLNAPTRNTLRNWIHASATPENVALREGKQVANRQMEGVHPHAQAFRPLETVVLDHTQIDLHIVILDAKGEVIERYERPYLIVVIDVFSRMVLAANLTLEAPSIYTLMAGLKQTVKPKDFVNHYRTSTAYGWATDGWGKFFRALVDNGLENIGRSLRSTAQAIRLDVSFAAVKTPEFKAVGERFFDTLNAEIWHEADGGVDEKPGRKTKDPRRDAWVTLPEAQERLWNWIVTVYHLRVHSELKMAPARKWSEGFKEHKRPMIDDINVVENAFGRSKTRQLTTAGIHYENERFHDPDITTSILHDLYYRNSKSRNAQNKNQSIAVTVEINVFDEDVSCIAVYNPVRRSYVRLPNRDPDAAGSYVARDEERGRVDQANEDFFSSVDLAINAAKHAASITKRKPPRHPDAPGKTISAAPQRTSETEGLPQDSPHVSQVHERATNEPPRKIRRRGQTKAEATRRRNAAAKKAKQKATDAATIAETVFELDKLDIAENVDRTRLTAFEVTDLDAFRQKLRAKLKLSNGT